MPTPVNSHTCTECGELHVVRGTRAHRLTKQELLMFKKACLHVIDTKVNDFKKSELELEEFGPAAYGNFPSLRYFGLITPVRDKQTDRPIKGRWLITRNGWSFLRNEYQIHKEVTIKNNTIVNRSNERIGILEVYKGADFVQTNFAYFDDDGHMVALRPALPTKPEQGTLL